MINIDSCCFSVHENYVKPDISKYDKIVRQKTETSQTYYEAKNICLGLNKITYMPETGIVTVDISGKLLPIQHKQLISQSNIENCIDIINGTGYLQADMLPLLENSTVRKIDFTENIEVSNVNEYLQAVACISSQKYNKDTYNGRGNDVGKTGVVFRGTFKTFKEYLLFYDKQAETKNEVYKNNLRIESKRSTFDSIRKDVKAQNNLLDILTSNEKPVLKVCNRIFGSNETNYKLYDNMKNIKSTQQLFYEALLLQSGNNMQTVKQFLLMANKRRATAYETLKRIELYKRNRNSTGTNTDYLKDILLKLSA